MTQVRGIEASENIILAKVFQWAVGESMTPLTNRAFSIQFVAGLIVLRTVLCLVALTWDKTEHTKEHSSAV